MYNEYVARKRQRTMSEHIRQLVDDSGMTRYAISMKTGIDQGTLSRFMAGSGLSLDNLDKLADLFGWVIAVRKKSKPKGK